MAPIKSYSYYDLDNGRPIIQQSTEHKNLSSTWHSHLLENGKTGKLSPASPMSQLTYPSDLDYNEMADSPESYQSSSQGSWEANDLLRQRPQSVSSVPAGSSPLSVNMTQDQLMTFGIYPGDEAHLVMKIPPENRFRYRYDTEMSGTHGSLQGIRAGKDKCLPTVELVNFYSEALIRVSLVTCNETGERYPHPHSLFVKEKMYQKNIYVNWDNKSLTKTGHYSDPHYIRVGVNKSDYTAKFEGMCIISSKKENFNSAIQGKLLRRTREQKNHRNHRDGSYWDGRSEVEELTKNVDKGVALVDVDFVSLCFEAFREENDKLIPICPPLYSSPIGNAKSAKTGKLKIARINKCSGSCKGGDEIWMLVEKINKKGLAIRFSEENNGRIVWESCIEGDDLILHHQYAIIFKTPPYRDVSITSEVVVTMRLERSSHPSQPCDYSEPMTFVYEPLKNKSTKSDNLYRKESMLTPLKQMHNKRPRTESSSVTTAYNFQNKRKPEDIEFPLFQSPAQDLSDIAQILQMGEIDIDGFGQAWSKFNPAEFERFLTTNDIEMALQKDGISSSKYRLEILCKYLRSKSLGTFGENDVKKLIDQINGINVTNKKDKSENKNGIDKVQLEDAASTLLSLRAKIVEENINTDFSNKNENDIVKSKKHELLKMESISDDLDENDGNTPLHFYLLQTNDNSIEKFQELLQEFRTCINIRNNEGKSPLHLAIEVNSLDCLKVLVESGADINLTESKSQRNALHMAVEKQNKTIAEYLVDIGLDFDARDSRGVTPLHLIYDLPTEQRQEFLLLYYSKKTKKENTMASTAVFKDANEHYAQEKCMDKIYEILNETGSWRKLAKLWEVTYFISHAEEAKNPAKSLFNCAEQKHGTLALEDLRNLLDGLNETKAVVIVDEMLARKFL